MSVPFKDLYVFGLSASAVTRAEELTERFGGLFVQENGKPKPEGDAFILRILEPDAVRVRMCAMILTAHCGATVVEDQGGRG